MTDRMFFILAFDLILVMSAISDARSLRIPNMFPIALLALFVIGAIWSGSYADLWRHGASFLIAIIIGVLLFSFSFLGGGDVKLFAATALWFTPGQLVALAFYITISGVLLTIIIYFLKVILSSRSEEGKWAVFRKKFLIPYGIAIAMGSIASIHFFSQT